jgi:hypothetical protein
MCACTREQRCCASASCARASATASLHTPLTRGCRKFAPATHRFLVENPMGPMRHGARAHTPGGPPHTTHSTIAAATRRCYSAANQKRELRLARAAKRAPVLLPRCLSHRSAAVNGGCTRRNHRALCTPPQPPAMASATERTHDKTLVRRACRAYHGVRRSVPHAAACGRRSCSPKTRVTAGGRTCGAALQGVSRYADKEEIKGVRAAAAGGACL